MNLPNAATTAIARHGAGRSLPPVRRETLGESGQAFSRRDESSGRSIVRLEPRALSQWAALGRVLAVPQAPRRLSLPFPLGTKADGRNSDKGRQESGTMAQSDIGGHKRDTDSVRPQAFARRLSFGRSEFPPLRAFFELSSQLGQLRVGPRASLRKA